MKILEIKIRDLLVVEMKILRLNRKKLDRLKYGLIIVIVSLICYNVCVNHVNVKGSRLKLMDVLWIYHNTLQNVCGRCVQCINSVSSAGILFETLFVRRSTNSATSRNALNSEMTGLQQENLDIIEDRNHDLITDLEDDNSQLIQQEQEVQDEQKIQEEQEVQNEQKYLLRGKLVSRQQVQEAMHEKKGRLEDFRKRIEAALNLDGSYEVFSYGEFFVTLYRKVKSDSNKMLLFRQKEDLQDIYTIPTWFILAYHKEEVPSSVNFDHYLHLYSYYRYLYEDHSIFEENPELWTKWAKEWCIYQNEMIKSFAQELTEDQYIQILKKLKEYDQTQESPILTTLFNHIESNCRQGYDTRDPNNYDDKYSKFYHFFHQIIGAQVSQFLDDRGRIIKMHHWVYKYQVDTNQPELDPTQHALTLKELIQAITYSEKEGAYLTSRIHEVPLLDPNTQLLTIAKKIAYIRSVVKLHTELQQLENKIMEKNKSKDLILRVNMLGLPQSMIDGKIWLQRACNFLTSLNNDPNDGSEREKLEQHFAQNYQLYYPNEHEFSDLDKFLHIERSEYRVSQF